MNELIGKKNHEYCGGKWWDKIVEIVSYTDKLLLVKIIADDDFETYECFEKRNGDWDFSEYWHCSDRKTALYLFDLDCKRLSA